jgi:hypothetical protein
MCNGQRIFIIGNGPSLNDVDMTALREKMTFSFNRAYIAYERWGFVPTFYSCVDTVVLPDNKEEINAMISDQAFKRTLFFFPFWASKELVPNPRTFFLPPSNSRREFNENLNAFSILGNVGATSIQIAVYLGFKEIILLGCDCNYVEKPQEVVIHEEESARVGYTAYESSDDSDPNHFSPEYFGRGRKYSIPNAPIHLAGWKKVRDWIDVYNACNSEHIHIRNVSRTSKLDFFQYIDFEESLGDDEIGCDLHCPSDQQTERKKIVIFGGSASGQLFLKEKHKEYQVAFFIDNNERLWGTTIFGKTVYSPEKLKTIANIDSIVVAVHDGEKKLSAQLSSLEVIQKCRFIA